MQVSVHQHDNVALTMGDSSGQRGGLAEVAPEADHRHMRIARGDLREPRDALIAAAVVNINYFIREAKRSQRIGNLLMEQWYVLLLVKHRDNNG